jgi:putative transposase
VELLPLTGGKKIGRFNESIKFDYMSRKGNCWDNAVAESFFKTMKAELIYHRKFATRQEARLAVFEYIEGWYNRKRRHSALGYRTPCHLESLYLENTVAA